MSECVCVCVCVGVGEVETRAFPIHTSPTLLTINPHSSVLPLKWARFSAHSLRCIEITSHHFSITQSLKFYLNNSAPFPGKTLGCCCIGSQGPFGLCQRSPQAFRLVSLFLSSWAHVVHSGHCHRFTGHECTALGQLKDILRLSWELPLSYSSRPFLCPHQAGLQQFWVLPWKGMPGVSEPVWNW